MWVLTPRGFYSVVAFRGRPGMVLVRARVEEDLKAITDGPIDRMSGTDYPFRVVMPREVWAGLLVEMAGEIDYPNFKEEVLRTQGWERAMVYGDVWQTLTQLEGL